MHVGRHVYRDHIITHSGSSLLNSIKFTSLCQSSTMMLLQFFTTAILLLSITSVRTYSVPYEGNQLAFSTIPRLIYTSESNPAFSGYSYTIQDFNGGESNVVFTTGADSASRLKNEMNLMKMPDRYSQRDMLNRNQENIISSEQQSKSVEAEVSKNKQDVEVLHEEKKSSENPKAVNNPVEHQTNLQQISFVDIPYPALTDNLLNLHRPVFPRYQISSNLIQSQYYPHNPYARLELPLHNFGFYNPTVPLFYQAATITIPDSNFKPASTAVENMKASVEPHATERSQTNGTSSESNSVKSSVESRFNLELTANTDEETSSQSAISMDKSEFMITERIKEEVTSSESAVTSQSSIEQTTDNKASSTELASTETSSSMEKSSTETPKRCTRCMEHLN